MAAILIYGQWPFVNIFNPPLTQGSTWSLKKFCPRVSKEKSFKGVNGQTDGRTDGWTECDSNSSSWTFGSGELKSAFKLLSLITWDLSDLWSFGHANCTWCFAVRLPSLMIRVNCLFTAKRTVKCWFYDCLNNDVINLCCSKLQLFLLCLPIHENDRSEPC